MDTVYLDNNATTRMDDEVLAEMMPYLTTLYGNASSMHTFGGQLGSKIEEARQRVAALLNCEASEIVFTSGGTESDNAAINGVLAADTAKRHLVISRVEHPAVRTTCQLKRKQGYQLSELPVNAAGQMSLDELAGALGDNVALVSIMYANNETGVIFPMERIAEIVKGRGLLLHVDAVQAVGKLPIDLQRLPVDLLSISGHKLHGPKGVGVLFVRRGTRLAPYLTGGHQESGRRAGTENVAGIVGLGKACELAGQHLDDERRRVAALRDRLEAGLLRDCAGARVNGDTRNRLPNTTNISFEFVEGEAILLLMDHLGIAASSGSACTSGSLEPSHVLRAMGVPYTCVHGSIRFSLSRYNTQAEIDYVIREMPAVINRLRQMSLFAQGAVDPEQAARFHGMWDRVGSQS